MDAQPPTSLRGHDCELHGLFPDIFVREVCYHHDLESFLLKAVVEFVSHEVMWAIRLARNGSLQGDAGAGYQHPQLPLNCEWRKGASPFTVSKLVSGVRFSMHHTAV